MATGSRILRLELGGSDVGHQLGQFGLAVFGCKVFTPSIGVIPRQVGLQLTIVQRLEAFGYITRQRLPLAILAGKTIQAVNTHLYQHQARLLAHPCGTAAGCLNLLGANHQGQLATAFGRCGDFFCAKKLMDADALAVERAIERETIETMSMQTTLARIQADDAAITLASKRIQAEISETTAIYSRLEDSSNEPDNDQNWGDTTPGKTKVAESVDDLQEHSMPTVRNEPAEENLPAYA